MSFTLSLSDSPYRYIQHAACSQGEAKTNPVNIHAEEG
jgi:hypothetical protein